jgi:hypothetical protein
MHFGYGMAEDTSLQLTRGIEGLAQGYAGKCLLDAISAQKSVAPNSRWLLSGTREASVRGERKARRAGFARASRAASVESKGRDRWRAQTGGRGIRSIVGGANKKADTTFCSIGFMCLAA